ncbi:type II toxin-antitoxin system ParD family antitoxin [Mycoplasmopsis felis]|uniref:type II toxin-antitoxin system ParD family antitoxin n=1 Tax=Mycoplasmopsis felis TaxID=33923 RepID=UPI0021E062BA|nr:type II toxin-antitoxin system ParD family antitoxin [Mycoplasmopsis felis]MCU9931817.1 type II toxin-antitoxin system ParD family antitoxin [Mycoplasmopsis felis]
MNKKPFFIRSIIFSYNKPYQWNLEQLIHNQIQTNHQLPVLSNDFPKFKDQAQEATVTNLAQALKTAISYLENELNKVVSEKDQVNEKDENGEPRPYDYKKKLVD